MNGTRSILCCLLAATWITAASALAAADPPANMKWIPAGDFIRGSDDVSVMANEHPATSVHVDGFWIDEHDVTNAEFRKFVEATGYVTTAERPVDWEALKQQVPPGTPKPAPAMLAPGALVFAPPDHPVPLDDMSAWWRWTPSANWRRPQGPTNDIAAQNDLPVVQVSWDDAAAYAKWAGKRLPTENEWEYAAWGGRRGTRYYWGNEFQPHGVFMCNTFTGEFPYHNTAADRFPGVSPVKSFPPNGFGLYDMAGNVWQWTSDEYIERRESAPGALNTGTMPCCDVSPTTNPAAVPMAAPAVSIQRVVKGGSYLCSTSYCESYRPSARRGVTPDTATNHTGFRCALSAPPSPSSQPFKKGETIP